MKQARFSKAGFTLLELMVSMGIMIALGASLMIVLRGGLNTWTTGEARRESSQIAQVVFSALREDLQCATIHRQRLGKTGPVDGRMISDFDQAQKRRGSAVINTMRQRLFLVRTIKAESENPITGNAGSSLNATGVVDLHDDKAESLYRELKSTGGLMEVGYVMGVGNTRVLYRMVRSPIGGDHSLFNYDVLPDQLQDELRDKIVDKYKVKFAGLEGIKFVRRAGPKIILHTDGSLDRDTIFESLEKLEWYKGELQDDLDKEDMDVDVMEGATQEAIANAIKDTKLSTWGKPLASKILFLGFEYWHEYTKSWDEEVEDSKRFEGRREHGAISYWDSTRGILQPQVPQGHFTLFKGAASRNKAEDDVLPARVRVTLVIAEPARAGTESELLTDIDAASETFKIREPGRAPTAPGYILIEDEWVRFSEINGNQITVDSNGRGARGTTATGHVSGQPAVFGRQFRLVIPIPGFSEDWSD
jgi:type II secretory pathway pseudopilin PulG